MSLVTFAWFTVSKHIISSLLSMLSAVGIVLGVGSLVTPALKSIMSKTVDPEDQGEYPQHIYGMHEHVWCRFPLECFAYYCYSHIHSTLMVTMMRGA